MNFWYSSGLEKRGIIIRVKTILFFAVAFSYGATAFSQDPCSFPGNKKDAEEYEHIVKSSKPRTAKIRELTEKGADFLDNSRLLFEIGRIQFLMAEDQEIPDYDDAQKSLEGAQKFCQELNPLLDYYLGIIYYYKQDYKRSLKSFNRFLLQSTNPDDKDHQLKLEDVRKSVSTIEQEMREYQKVYAPSELITPELLRKVSTPSSEYLPMLSPDNSLLLFTRKYKKEIKGDPFPREVEEFSLANRTSDSMEFDEGKALPPPFNEWGNYGGASISVNNKELFITVCIQLESGYKNCDIFTTKYELYQPDPKDPRLYYHWTDLKNIGTAINSSDTWEAQPSISPDGRTLYFSKYGADTRETDLYFSERDATGEWKPAVAFPEPINSAGHDKAPFMHQDGKTLYFSSTGRIGEGGFDIYYTIKVDSVNWSRPKTVGRPICTENDEHGMMVSTDGKYAVFASNGSNTGAEQYDIYYVEMPEKGRPEEIIFIKGKLDSATASTHLRLKDAQGNTLREIEFAKDDGAYVAIINRKDLKEPLVLNVEQDGVAFQARIIDSTRVQHGTVDNEHMLVNQIQSNNPYTIEDIHFESNSAVIMDGSKFMLNEFSRFLMKNASYSVVIQGHTDNSGDKDNNLRLSNERALSVKNYLISKGVPTSRLDHKGFGDTIPLESNSTQKGRAKNRRTEFILK